LNQEKKCRLALSRLFLWIDVDGRKVKGQDIAGATTVFY